MIFVNRLLTVAGIIPHVLFLALAPSVTALEDTPRNRQAAAERYLHVAPPECMTNILIDAFRQKVPEKYRDRFNALMRKYLNMTAIRQAAKSALLSNFSADELQLCANFYSTSLGRSIFRKLSSLGNLTPDQLSGLASQFTAPEAEALKEFYSSPTGQSILSKSNSFWAEILPVVKDEMRKALVQVTRALQA
jgi:hypothetical protein